jgi:hypothetical protein
VVSVPATGPKCCGFEPGQDDGFLRAIKIRSTPSFGWEVKLEVPCRKILRHDISRIPRSSHFLRVFSYSLQRWLLTGPPDSTGGCQSALVDKFGVSPSDTIVPWSTSQSPGDEQARRDRSSETSDLPHHNQSNMRRLKAAPNPYCYWILYFLVKAKLQEKGDICTITWRYTFVYNTKVLYA